MPARPADAAVLLVLRTAPQSGVTEPVLQQARAGMEAFARGDHVAAGKAFHAATHAEPHVADHFANLACALRLMGQPKHAATAARRASELAAQAASSADHPTMRAASGSEVFGHGDDRANESNDLVPLIASHVDDSAATLEARCNGARLMRSIIARPIATDTAHTHTCASHASLFDVARTDDCWSCAPNRCAARESLRGTHGFPRKELARAFSNGRGAML